jgi:hypothetical protein
MRSAFRWSAPPHDHPGLHTCLSARAMATVVAAPELRFYYKNGCHSVPCLTETSSIGLVS